MMAPSPIKDYSGYSRNDLLDLLRQHAIERRRLQQDRVRVIRTAREAGLTNQQIGDVLGVTEAAVRFYLRRHEDQAGEAAA